MTQDKVNIAELLKDCPKGMALDCTMFEDNCVEFSDIVDSKFLPIRCRIKKSDGGYNFYDFTKYGCWIDDDKAKCVIFPKGRTTWEGFIPPCQFKDGDVLISAHGKPFILKKIHNNKICESYCGIRQNGEFVVESHNWTSNYNLRLATKEEKAKLFDAIKANGYKWNEKTKTLEKLVEPKFKVGDKVLWNYDTKIIRTISKVQLTKSRGYVYWIDCEGCSSGWWNENELTPIPNKFDINTLKPFESKVLMRSSNAREWVGTIFSHYNNKFYGCGMCCDQCIPYEGNEHLLGKTDDCDEYFKNW